MSFYTSLAFRLFGDYTESIAYYFPYIKVDLKRAGMKTSSQEFICVAILTSFFVFLFEVPILSFIFGFVFQGFLFSFITAFTVSIALAALFFFVFLNYPKAVAQSKTKEIDSTLPFASLYLSTVAGSKLPLHKSLEIFAKFSGYGEIRNQINLINNDMKLFGLDVETAVERAVDRSPSRNFKELLWGMLSTIKSGGNLGIFLKEKSSNFMEDHRRKLYEFSRTLTIYIEVYLTAIILGAMFFTILTAIMSGIGGPATGSVVMLQFFLIFIFIPVVSSLFIFIIKSSAPGGE